MAGPKKGSDTEYVLKRGGDEVIVEPCKGWMDSCDYCDKRFGSWIHEDEEVYEKMPEKPGFFMIALRTKNTTEVVSLSYAESSIQKSAIPCMDMVNVRISNKKSKSTKSTLLIRWMVIKNVPDKDNAVLCAHWCNNGVLPKNTTSWPGMNLLEDSDYLMMPKFLQKWCYAKKDPVWRKPKIVSSKIVEKVKKCTYDGPCEVCDTNFTRWQDISNVMENKTAPSENGLVMFSVVYGKKREVILISSDVVEIKIRETQFSANQKSLLRDDRFVNKNEKLEVRWIVIKDNDSDNACFLYAHWFNADRFPLFNYGYLPGEKSLNKNKHFVFRKNEKKWMYEIEAFKQDRFNKQKNKRRIREEFQDEDFLETENSLY